MSGGGSPKDRSVELAQQQHQYEVDAANQKKIDDAKALAKWNNQNNAAKAAARATAENYFTSQGLDPANYQKEINDYIHDQAGGVAELSTGYADAYDNAGQTVYNNLQTGERNQATSALDKLFSPGWEASNSSYGITDKADDPFIAEIEAEQEKQATDYLNNLLTRGVITDTGYQAGMSDIGRQEAGVLATLNTLGSGQIASGRDALTNISNKGYQTAGNLKLGSDFNAGDYQQQVETAFQDWLGNLGTNLRGGVGNKPLYDTSGLAAIAGGAQGAGKSQVFDPKALAGINEEPSDDTKKRTGESTGLDF